MYNVEVRYKVLLSEDTFREFLNVFKNMLTFPKTDIILARLLLLNFKIYPYFYLKY